MNNNNVKKRKVNKVTKDKVFRFLLTNEQKQRLIEKAEKKGYNDPSKFLRSIIDSE